MNLSILVENEPTDDPRLVPEHGLSMLVQTKDRRILFDTGASGVVVHNAALLGLTDALTRLDAIVISHGHSDHAGGLAAVLALAPKPIPVHVRPGFFQPRISTHGGGMRAIGVPLSQAELEARGARFVIEEGSREIGPGVWLTGEIPLREEPTAGEASLYLGTTVADRVPDTFTDEHAMAVMTPLGLAVLIGCAHRGIVNSLLAAKIAANGTPIHLVAGGAHLRSTATEHIDWTLRQTHDLAETASLGHCTGLPAEDRFARGYGDGFHPLRMGWRWSPPIQPD